MSVAPCQRRTADATGDTRGESQPRARLHALREDGSRAQTADDVLGLLDRGRLQRADRLGDLVGRGSEAAVRVGVDRVIEMPSPLRKLLPGGGLRRGSTVTVRGSTSLLLAMLGAATRAGSWCVVVGMPHLGLVAAELGVDLDRLAMAP